MSMTVIQATPDIQATFATLYSTHAHDVARRVHGIVRDPLDAEDAIQETWAKVYCALPQTPHVHAGWLWQVAHNAACDVLRQGRRPIRQTVPIMVIVNEEGHEEMLAGLHAQEGDRDMALDRRALVEQLRPQDRLLLKLRAAGYSFAEISAALEHQGYGSVSEFAVKNRIARAREKLREMSDMGTIAAKRGEGN